MVRALLFVVTLLLSFTVSAQRRHSVELRPASRPIVTADIPDPSLIYSPSTGFHVKRVLDAAEALNAPATALTWHVRLDAVTNIANERAHGGIMEVMVWRSDGGSAFCIADTLQLPTEAGSTAEFTLDASKFNPGDIIQFEDWDGLRVTVEVTYGATRVYLVTQGVAGGHVNGIHSQAEINRCR